MVEFASAFFRIIGAVSSSVYAHFTAFLKFKNRPHRISPTRSVWLFNLCLSRILSALKQHLCQDTLSEPASVQIHLFFKFNIVSWLNFCLCAYSHRFFRKNSVIQIHAFAFGTLLLAKILMEISSLLFIKFCIHIGRFMSRYLGYNANMLIPQIQRKNVGISKINRKTIAEF